MGSLEKTPIHPSQIHVFDNGTCGSVLLKPKVGPGQQDGFRFEGLAVAWVSNEFSPQNESVSF